VNTDGEIKTVAHLGSFGNLPTPVSLALGPNDTPICLAGPFCTYDPYETCTGIHIKCIDQWEVQFDAAISATTTPLVVDSTGAVYVAGTSQGSSLDFLVIKYDSQGIQQWVVKRDFNGNADQVTGLVLDSTENVIVAGASDLGIGLLKLDPDGNEIWFAQPATTFSNVDTVDATAPLLDQGGNVVIAAYAIDTTGGDAPSYLTLYRFSPAGHLLWAYQREPEVAGFACSDSLRCIALDENANVFTLADVFRSGIYVYKIDQNGNLVWSSIMPPYGLEWALAVDKNGNVWTANNTLDNHDLEGYQTAKLDHNGTVVWTDFFRPTDSTMTYPEAILFDSSNDALIVGGHEYSDFGGLSGSSDDGQGHHHTGCGCGS
jgi:hypothetical protein